MFTLFIEDFDILIIFYTFTLVYTKSHVYKLIKKIHKIKLDEHKKVYKENYMNHNNIKFGD